MIKRIILCILLTAGYALAHENDVWVDATYPSGQIIGGRNCGWAGNLWEMKTGEIRPVLFSDGHLHYPNPDHPYTGGLNCDDLVEWQMKGDEK